MKVSNHIPRVYVSIANFNLFCSRTRGWAPRGEKARAIVASSRGSNIHIVGAMSEHGMVSYSVKRGSFTKISCQEWLRTMLDGLVESRRRKVVVVCDNALCHSDLGAGGCCGWPRIHRH